MYIYGKNVVYETLKKGEKINKAFISDNFKDKNLINLLINKNVDIKYLKKHELDKMVNGMHQGIIVDVNEFEYSNLEDFLTKENSFILILDHIEDPHNLGAIIRTVEASGVDLIVLPKNRSAKINSTVVKVSTGAINNVKIANVVNINSTIQTLKDNGFWIIGTDMEGSDYTTIDYQGKIAIIIGNEGKGLSPLVRKNCDFIASIPMYGTINSLNASVATGIIVFEALRQRK